MKKLLVLSFGFSTLIANSFDQSFAETPHQCDTSGTACVVREPCEDNGRPCPPPRNHARGAQHDNNQVLYHSGDHKGPPRNSEQLLPNQVFQFWGLPAEPEAPIALEKTVVTVKEETVAKQISADVDPIRFESGRSVIPEHHVIKMKAVLESLKARNKLRLHFIGHTDNVRLSARARARYGDNIGLSQSRAKQVAELFTSRLDLQDIEISWEGKGDTQAIAPNETESGRALNRRVEIQVWFEEKVVNEVETESTQAVVPEQLRTMVCPRGTQNDSSHDELSGMSPFRISVDGQPLEIANAPHSADQQRCTDVALNKASIHIQYDNLLLKPRLAVSAQPSVIQSIDNPNTDAADNLLTFVSYSNYHAFWERAEIRIFDADRSTQTIPLAVVPLGEKGGAQAHTGWQYPDDQNFVLSKNRRSLKYVLRVYDHDGHFDQTHAQYIDVRHRLDSDSPRVDLLAAYGENQLDIQNIHLRGGSVTVNGAGIPSSHEVAVMGLSVPVDTKGQFVHQQVVPHGYHTVEVSVLDEEGAGALFHRDLRFGKSDWFYVGIADLTIGWRDTNGPASEVTQDDRYNDDNFIDGRLAFYVKGKTSRDWNITASADTREQPIEDLFSNFTNKDPTLLFRRLDPDYYYPTFGDDSTLEEDAPTQGKFYFKAEKNKNYGVWGNFETGILDTELARVDRGLYGAQGHFESKSATSHGEKRTQLDLYVAEPGTIGAREEFRGTGGSLYFLRNQNITLGSERVRIEIRDKDTDLVLQRRRLVAGSDYDIDPIQGRIVLNSPLASTSVDGLLVRDDSIAGNPNFLVVSYEYTPGFEELDEIVVGGRASQWLGDHVKLGVTANDQEQTGVDQTLYATDLTLRSSSGNYLKFEYAETEGLSTDQFASFDGGFEFDNTQTGVLTGEPAQAGRVETAFSLGTANRISAFYQSREAGFSSTGQFVDRDTDQYGVNVSSYLSKRVNLTTKLAAREQDQGQETETLDAVLDVALNPHWHLDAGVRYDKQVNTNPALPTAGIDQGERTDGTIELGYSSENDWSAFVFAQGTLNREETRDANNRGGVGGSYRVSDRLNIEGEVSDGNTGVGARLATDYVLSEDTNLYLAFGLENERAGNSSTLRGRRGNVTSGFKTRYSDNLSIYGEERYAYGDQPTGLTHLYGIDFAPAKAWSLGASIETGELDNTNGDSIERLALGLSLGYSEEKIQYATALEFRNDKSVGNERDTWLLRNELVYKNNDNWRTIGKLNYSRSESSQGAFFDGDFTEAIWGYAYRPVENDHLNGLVKYTYFFNKPAPEQVSTRNINTEFIQRSHIVSADMNYDLSSRWTLGAKYAFRRGELALDRVDPEYFRSDAHLLVLRADWHVVKHWDLLVEGRQLRLPDAEDDRSGMLFGIYRHIGSNLKLGVGYNFTEFSDDLTDLSFDSEGVFINAIGKF